MPFDKNEATISGKIMRYKYVGKDYRHHPKNGFYCDPVKDSRGKCIVGTFGSQLVKFEDGTTQVVVRRALRLVSKLKGDNNVIR